MRKFFTLATLFLLIGSTAFAADKTSDTDVLYVPDGDTATVRLKPDESAAVYAKSTLKRITGEDVELYGLDQIRYSVREYRGITVQYDIRNGSPITVRASEDGEAITMTVVTGDGQYKLAFQTVEEPPYHRTVRLGESPPETVKNDLIVIRVEPGQALDERTWSAVEEILSEKYPQKPYHYDVNPFLGVVVLNKSESGQSAKEEILSVFDERNIPYDSHSL